MIVVLLLYKRISGSPYPQVSSKIENRSDAVYVYEEYL